MTYNSSKGKQSIFGEQQSNDTQQKLSIQQQRQQQLQNQQPFNTQQQQQQVVYNQQQNQYQQQVYVQQQQQQPIHQGQYYQQQQPDPPQGYYNQQNQHQELSYMNPDYIPDKIDMNYYQINTINYKVKFISLLQFSSQTEIFSVAIQQAQQVQFKFVHYYKSEAKFEQQLVAKTLDGQVEEMETNTTYRVSTQNGTWFCKLNEVDRITMSNSYHYIQRNYQCQFCHALLLIQEVEKELEDPELLRLQSGTTIVGKMEERLRTLTNKTQKYENFSIADLPQVLTVQKQFIEIEPFGITNPMRIKSKVLRIEQLKIKEVEKKSDAFSAKKIMEQLKQTSQNSIGPCICIIVFLGLCFLIYWFVLRDILTPDTQQQPLPARGNNHKHIKID